MDHATAKDQLEAARRATLNRIGSVNEHVMSRMTPLLKTGAGPATRFWPSSALGKQVLVRCEDSVLVTTDGISDPWDLQLQPDAPGWTFGFELALEVPFKELADTTDDGIASSWITALLWAATDWLTAERVDLKGLLIKSECATLAIPPVRGLEKLVGANGFMGSLVGIPFIGSDLRQQVILAPEPENPEDAVWLLPLKLLTADEYDWALGVQDGARAKALAGAFLKDSSRHLSWPGRPSVLPQLGVAQKRKSLFSFFTS